ncbi:F-box associated domain type 1 [Arabidopsis suecica]|uniref:F-box associated domain type 1 n=1 Tax=Arabidopsis suecica TaxID=45249 RepID=A0A8T2B503_ARASU|nr:F-box associated domain type 1 [Arabidopsis suecica]
MIVLMNLRLYSNSVDLEGINKRVDPAMEVTGKLIKQNDSEAVEISNIFHCDGLILCTTEGNTRLVVWNPCTGETRCINPDNPRKCYKNNDRYALGYGSSTSSCHSYKILRSCCYFNDQSLMDAEFEIYDFSTDSWRDLGYITRDLVVFSSGMSLKGNTYWVSGTKDNGFFMLYFDFKTERFGRLPLPYQSFNAEDTAALSVVGDEKLAVLHQSILAFSDEMRIWVTNKIDEAKDLSWSDFLLTVDYGKFNFPYLVNVTSFLLDEENKVAVCSDLDIKDGRRNRIYIVGKGYIYKEVYKETTKGSDINWPLLLSYVPSLVNIQENTRLVVWNPCTGQTKWIKRSTFYRRDDLYCLGYVNSKSSYHSYKILRYCFYYNNEKVCVCEFEIYDFSSDSWRVLDDCTHNWGLFCDGMSLKGNTYFVAGEQETGFFMLYFDFKTERFERLPLPYQSFNCKDTAVLSVVREEKLAVLHQNILAFSSEMRIWVTNKIDEAKNLTWSNFILTVDYDRFNLPSVTNVSSFLLDEENKVAVCCDRDMDDEDKTRIYIVGENIYKEVYKETIKGSHFNWPLLLSYLPSLVHIQENTPKRQKKRKQEEVS